MRLNKYTVSILTRDASRWSSVGVFKARSEQGAIQQFARDLRHFNAVVAVKAEQV